MVEMFVMLVNVGLLGGSYLFRINFNWSGWLNGEDDFFTWWSGRLVGAFLYTSLRRGFVVEVFFFPRYLSIHMEWRIGRIFRSFCAWVYSVVVFLFYSLLYAFVYVQWKGNFVL